jgi:hypothetical protein
MTQDHARWSTRGRTPAPTVQWGRDSPVSPGEPYFPDRCGPRSRPVACKDMAKRIHVPSRSSADIPRPCPVSPQPSLLGSPGRRTTVADNESEKNRSRTLVGHLRKPRGCPQAAFLSQRSCTSFGGAKYKYLGETSSMSTMTWGRGTFPLSEARLGGPRFATGTSCAFPSFSTVSSSRYGAKQDHSQRPDVYSPRSPRHQIEGGKYLGALWPFLIFPFCRVRGLAACIATSVTADADGDVVWLVVVSLAHVCVCCVARFVVPCAVAWYGLGRDSHPNAHPRFPSF